MESVDKLRIAFVVPYFYPLRGGTENNCLNMALKSAELGHEVTVFTSDRKKNSKLQRKFERYQGITIRRLSRRLFNQYYLSFLPSLPWHLYSGDFDVIHSHIPGVVWTDLSLIFKKLTSRKTKFINTPHDPFMSRASYGTFANIMRRLYLPILRLYYSKLYDYVIAVNADQVKWIQGDYKVPEERIILVENGIPDELLETTEVDSGLKKQYLPDNKLLITTVARYHEYKGYQHTLAAIKKLKDEHHDLPFKFIGIGEDTGMYSRLTNFVRDNNLEDDVTLLNSPNDSVRDQLLELSEIFILPSRVEAFGIAIMEAMAKSNAIITTATEGGKYLVKPENGYLFNFGDTNDLANLIWELVNNSEKRNEMINTNIKKAQQYTWSNTFRSYEKLLSQFINS